MPHIGELKKSSFMTKFDCDPPILVTMQEVKVENIAKDNQPEDIKWLGYLVGYEKPFVINSTNGQLLAAIAQKNGIVGFENSDNWGGLQFVLYHDPNIAFGPKVIGGIRVRAPKIRPAPAAPARPVTADVPSPPPRPAPAPAPAPPAAATVPAEEEDDVPF